MEEMAIMCALYDCVDAEQCEMMTIRDTVPGRRVVVLTNGRGFEGEGKAAHRGDDPIALDRAGTSKQAEPATTKKHW